MTYCMVWESEVAWCAELLIMYRRWCDTRGMDERWYDELDERRRWVRMNMRLGDAQSHLIVIARHSGSPARLVDAKESYLRAIDRLEDE